ncbi:hypothetical protein ACHAXT_000019, partial [Thalassiosira profunda]
ITIAPIPPTMKASLELLAVFSIAVVALPSSEAFQPSAASGVVRGCNLKRVLQSKSTLEREVPPTENEAVDSPPSTQPSAQSPALIFPGGGLFFYWQAGVVAYLQEQGYDLSTASMSGASAGALSATLAKTGVCPYDATKLALKMSAEAGVWDRPLGLQGVWGGIIEKWLDRLLPIDAEERAGEDLHILVTPVEWLSFGKSRVSEFESRRELIDANMASVHLPWFLDGNLMKDFRGAPHIDGSFLAKPSDYFCNVKHAERSKLVLDFKRDPVMRGRASEFVKLVSEQTIWDILEQGKKHAKIMDRDGEFDLLDRRG